MLYWNKCMRYRVDFEYGGYASYDCSEVEKAWEVYYERGIRIRKCNDIFDDGIVIDGKPIFEDHTSEQWNKD